MILLIDGEKNKHLGANNFPVLPSKRSNTTAPNVKSVPNWTFKENTAIQIWIVNILLRLKT